MSDPAVLVPSGLAQIHPQLETSIKSIVVAIRSLQNGARTAGTASATATGGGTADLVALQQQVQALQAQIGAINQGRGFALFCS